MMTLMLMLAQDSKRKADDFHSREKATAIKACLLNKPQVLLGGLGTLLSENMNWYIFPSVPLSHSQDTLSSAESIEEPTANSKEGQTNSTVCSNWLYLRHL